MTTTDAPLSPPVLWHSTACRSEALVLVAVIFLTPLSAQAQERGRRVIEPRELIVELRTFELGEQLKSDLAKRTTAHWRPVFPKATKKGAERLAKFRKVQFGSTPERESAIAYLLGHTAVRGVERPEVKGRFLECAPGVTRVEPGDEFFASSGTWGQAYGDQWGLHAIRAPEAWCEEKGDPNLIVAILDTGVHYKHLDLQGRFWVNPLEDINENGVFDDWPSSETRNGVSGDLDGCDNGPFPPSEENPCPEGGNGYVDDVIGVNLVSPINQGWWNVSDSFDFHTGGTGHGTAIAGIIGASTDNQGSGVAGINWNSQLMVVRIGVGDVSTNAEAIVYAVNNGARVINASWELLEVGGRSAVLEAALDYAYRNRVVVCVAAGNFAGVESETLYPQSDPRVLNITMMTPQNEPRSSTSLGARTDVTAPGGGEPEDTTEPNGQRAILSTAPPTTNVGEVVRDQPPDGRYQRVSGTSFAAPHVAGVVSLILSRHPELDVEQVRQALRLGAVDVSDPGWDPATGSGRLDALNSLLLSDGPLGKARIFTPISRSDISLSSSVRIRGTAWASAFDRYDLMIAAGTNPQLGDWQVIGSGTVPVEDGLLLDLDPTPLNLAPGQHMLRLVVFGDGREYEDRMTVFVGPNGAPQDALKAGTPPVVGDVDGDGEPEIVTFAGVSHYVLAVFSGDGALEASVVLEACTPAGYAFFGGPALGDLDLGSAGLEIAVLEFDQLRVMRGDGTDCAGWPQPIDIDRKDLQRVVGEFYNRVVLEDLDGDGELEVLAFRLAAGQHKLTAFTSSGVESWEIVFAGGDPVEPATIAVGDVTGPTSDPEIVVLQGDFLRILDGDGVEVRSDSLGLVGRAERPSLALADLTGDGKLDIAASQSTESGLSVDVSVLDGNLNFVEGWPQRVEPSGGSAVSGAITALAVADMDGDLSPEVVVNLSDEIVVFAGDGFELTAAVPFEEPGIMTPVVLADVSGDGLPEVVATTASARLVSFDLQTGLNIVHDLAEADPPSASAAWDLNGDSAMDVVTFQQGRFFLGCFNEVNLRVESTSGTGVAPWPMAHGGPRRTGSFPETSRFLRGDSNNDCERNIADASFTLGFLFLDTGDVPKCQDAVDTNNDGAMNVSDPQYLLNYLFLGGPPPPEPLDCPGVENPVEDALTCVTSTCPRCPAPCQPCP